MTPIPPIPAYLKRWSPAARLEECGKPHGYMIGDKEGLWYFASAVDERIAKLTAANAELERENAHLKAPVSDEEWNPRCYFDEDDSEILDREGFNAIIRSRAAIKEGQ